MTQPTDNVVDLGAFRFSRQTNDRQHPDRQCRHSNLELDDAGEIVRCKDCGDPVGAYWTLKAVLSAVEEERARLKRQLREIEALKSSRLHLVAAKRIEQMWRGRKMTPVCPHCRKGILPGDGMGSQAISTEFELGMRARQAAKEPTTA